MASSQSPPVSNTAKNVPNPKLRLCPVSFLQFGQLIISMTGCPLFSQFPNFSIAALPSCDLDSLYHEPSAASLDEHPQCRWQNIDSATLQLHDLAIHHYIHRRIQLKLDVWHRLALGQRVPGVSSVIKRG